jgi:polyphosphate glucokinase
MPVSKNRKPASPTRPITLTIDIGGSGIKALRLDPKGQPLTERFRIPTPQPATPKAVIHTIMEIAEALQPFDRVSVGFPGVIKHGHVRTAPNLDASWPGTELVGELEKKLKKPVRAANDADVQGYGAIEGRGVELIVTLGTGFGTSLFVDGHLVPNLEIAHHPFQSNQTYDQIIGATSLKRIGKKKWNQRLAKAITILDRVINYDRLYLGGGNAKKVSLTLPPNVTIISNVAGLLGGIALWTNGQGLRELQPSPTANRKPRATSRPTNKTTRRKPAR